jgi:hypothetical protein
LRSTIAVLLGSKLFLFEVVCFVVFVLVVSGNIFVGVVCVLSSLGRLYATSVNILSSFFFIVTTCFGPAGNHQVYRLL